MVLEKGQKISDLKRFRNDSIQIVLILFRILYVERNKLGKVRSSINKSSLNFRYETLEKATDFFSPSNKIGQGGAGSVYKGILPNGETVAVKRLVFNTRQWVDEFFNEVNLISGIHHKNLVRLLGCSIEGPESLLVYEYVPKRSLDQFLFGNYNYSLIYLLLKRFSSLNLFTFRFFFLDLFSAVLLITLIPYHAQNSVMQVKMSNKKDTTAFFMFSFVFSYSTFVLSQYSTTCYLNLKLPTVLFAL